MLERVVRARELRWAPLAANRQRRPAPVAWPAMSDRTLVLLKPDAVERGLVGAILSRFEAKGLTIAAMDLRPLDKDTLARHYEEHVGKAFYDDLVTFMSRGPVVAMVVEGPEDTWEVVRTLMGATNPRKADPARSAAISGSCSPRTSCTAATRARVGRARGQHLLPATVIFGPSADR